MSTTGISAGERAATIVRLGSPDATPEDFVRPGHVFPLRYREGGVLKRTGHTEAAMDLSRMAGRGAAVKPRTFNTSTPEPLNPSTPKP